MMLQGGAFMVQGAADVGPTRVLDTFTDSDNTELTLHNPDTDVLGGGWSKVQGDFDIDVVSNKATPTGTPTSAQIWYTIDSGISDIDFSCDVTTGADLNEPAGVIFRFSDSSNWWRVYLRSKDGIVLQEITGGSVSTRDSAGGIANSTTYTVRVVADGTSIDVYLDGVATLAYTSSSHQSATDCGLLATAADAQFDNFEVATP